MGADPVQVPLSEMTLKDRSLESIFNSAGQMSLKSRQEEMQKKMARRKVMEQMDDKYRRKPRGCRRIGGNVMKRNCDHSARCKGVVSPRCSTGRLPSLLPKENKEDARDEKARRSLLMPWTLW